VAIVPYFGFARQDRVTREGRPLGAKVVADVLGTGRFSQVIAVDLHSPVVASCVETPVAHLTATHGLFVGDALERLRRPEVIRVLVTDSLPPATRAPSPVEVIRLGPLLAEAVRRIAGWRGLHDLLADR
jgi:phosphoribosylpyrophosphate synthetase